MPGRSFLVAFALTFTTTVAAFGGMAWLATAWVGPTPAERFRSGAFEFELPPGRTCAPQETGPVCRKTDAPRPAIVILTMTERGPSDTVQAHRRHLETPQALMRNDGTTTRSTVLSVEHRRIGGRDWVVGRHFESEVPGFHTAYYAALTSHKAVLVTFSAHAIAVDAFRPDLERMIDTLKLYQH